jgi:predicted Ser/Thr protein kinase
MNPDPLDGLTEHQLQLIDAACLQLEASLAKHGRSIIEQLVEDADTEVVSTLLRELIEVELEARTSLGESPGEAVYLKRFPNQDAVVRQAFQSFSATMQTVNSPSTSDVFGLDPGPTRLASSEAKPSTGIFSAQLKDSDLPREFGRYQLTRLLGRGGMGIVFRAEDRQLGREVALKMPLFPDQPELAEELRSRFHREARVMASLRNSTLCPVYDVGELDGAHFLTMPLLEGSTLRDLLREHSAHPPTHVAAVLMKLAQGLAEAHRAGVVHRDLKPSNIMVDENHEPIIMDFGLAHRRADGDVSITRSGDVVGTPHYMSPEQLRGNTAEIGPATDVFSLGVIGYELLTGQRPFQGSLAEVAAGILKDDPEPPSLIKHEVDSSIEAICLKAMARDAASRYVNAEELAAALQDYLRQRASASDQIGEASGTEFMATAEARAGEQGLAHDFFAQLEADHATRLDHASSETVLLSRSDTRPVHQDVSREQTGFRKWIIAVLVLAAGSATLVAMLPAWFGFGRGSHQDFGVAGTAGKNADTRVSKSSTDEPHETTSTVIVDSSPPDAWQQNPLLSSDYEWSELVNLGPGVNTSQHEDHLCVSTDGLTMLFVRSSNPQVMFQSQRASVDDAFGPAVPLSATINDPSHSPACPFLSADGLTLWFTSTRPGGQGKEDVWFSRRVSPDAPFGEPTNAGPHVNSTDDEAAPFLSADGLTLLFARGFPRHIYESTRSSIDAQFRPARRLDSVSVGRFSQFARISTDGLAMVLRGLAGHPDEGLCIARRRSVNEDFSPPVSLGEKFNAFKGSALALSGDDRTLYFAVDHPGGQGSYDLWSSTRVLKTGSTHQSPRLPQQTASQEGTPPVDDPSSLVLDGTKSWVDFRGLPFDSSSPFTLEAITQIDTDGHGSTVMALSEKGTVKVMAVRGNWEVAISDNRNGEIHVFPDAVEKDRWVHVAVTHESGLVSLFVNGQRCESKHGGRFGLGKDPLHRAALGTHLGSSVSNALHGRVAEIRFSSVVRYLDNFTPPPPAHRFDTDDDTVALYHFEDEDGTTLHDASSNGHNGTIHDAGWN